MYILYHILLIDQIRLVISRLAICKIYSIYEISVILRFYLFDWSYFVREFSQNFGNNIMQETLSRVLSGKKA